MDGITGDTLPVGSIVPFGSDTVPQNWLLCDGHAVSRTEYAELFSVIGGNYGVGDGSTTFNLPDLRGRLPLGKGTGTGAGGEVYNFELGNKGGEYSHILTVDEMPSHTHIIKDTENEATRVQGYGESTQHTGLIRTDANVEWTNHTLTAAPTGGGAAHNLLQPFEVHNFIIKVKQSSGVVATVVDGLNSTSATDALSAKQGKILNEKATRKVATLYNVSDVLGEGYQTKIKLDTLTSNTDVLTYADNSVVIGKGISKVLVSGNAFAIKGQTDMPYLWTVLRIDRNGTEINISFALDAEKDGFACTSHSGFLIDVQEGDKIYLASMIGQLVYFRGVHNTYLTVEVVD